MSLVEKLKAAIPVASLQLTLDNRRRWTTRLVLLLAVLGWIRAYLLPRLVQRFLDKAILKFRSVQMSSIRQNGSFRMTLHATIEESGPLPVMLQAQVPAELHFKSLTGDRYVVAKCTLPEMQLQSSGANELRMKVEADVADEDGFGLFGARLLNASKLDFELNIPSLHLYLFHELICIQNLSLKKQLSMPAMDGLKEVDVLSVMVEEGTRHHILIRTQTRILNPSSISINMGTTEFLLIHEGEQVGRMVLPHASMRPGYNDFQALVYYAPGNKVAAQRAGRRLLSQHLAGLASVIQVRGHPDSCQRSESGGGHFLAPAVASMRLTTILPGQPTPLIQEARLWLFQTNPVTMIAPSSLLLQNPFDAPVTISRIEGVVTLSPPLAEEGQESPTPTPEDVQGGAAARSSTPNSWSGLLEGSSTQPLGHLSVQLEEPWRIEARSEFLSTPVPMRVAMSLATVNALVQVATTKGLRVDVEAELDCLMGEFALTVSYKQLRVPVVLS